MNPRDLPVVVAELIIEMHEVRTELKEVRTELKEVGTELKGMRDNLRALPERIGTATIRALEPFLNRMLEHDDLLRNHASRLNNLENPQH
jgi:DNA repair ATPase RecN